MTASLPSQLTALFDGIFDDLPEAQKPKPRRKKRKFRKSNRVYSNFLDRFPDRRAFRHELKSLYKSGKSLEKVAAYYGVSAPTIQRAMKTLRIKRRSRGGANNHNGSRSLQYYRVDGHTGTLPELADVYKIPLKLIYSRLSRGWLLRDALMIPKQPNTGHRCPLRGGD